MGLVWNSFSMVGGRRNRLMSLFLGHRDTQILTLTAVSTCFGSFYTFCGMRGYWTCACAACHWISRCFEHCCLLMKDKQHHPNPMFFVIIIVPCCIITPEIIPSHIPGNHLNARKICIMSQQSTCHDLGHLIFWKAFCLFTIF